MKGEVSQLSPQVSESTESKSPWKIPVPHASGRVMNILIANNGAC